MEDFAVHPATARQDVAMKRCSVLIAVIASAASATAQPLLDAERFVISNTALIETINGDGQSGLTGFGFVVGESAGEGMLFVVTAHHVIRDAKTINVRFCTDVGVSRTATVLKSQTSDDVAVLRVVKPAYVAWNASVLSSEPPKLNDSIWVGGTPGLCRVPRGSGSVNQARSLTFSFEGLVVGPGSSGAPLLGQRGLVGMLLEDATYQVDGVLIEVVRNIVEASDANWGLRSRGGSDTGYGWSSGIPLPFNRRLSWHTVISGLGTGAAVFWQRSTDREVVRAVDRYDARGTTVEAIDARRQVENSLGRRDAASGTVVGTAVLTGVMLILDIIRKPPGGNQPSGDLTRGKFVWDIRVCAGACW